MDNNAKKIFLPIFSYIEGLPADKTAIIAIDGGSASGKTTLASILKERYACNVIRMDDFFLRPEQRTPERFAEVGGNVDRERFESEVLPALKNNEAVCYQPYDCRTQTLGEKIILAPNKITVVEGVYSMHPEFSRYYDVAIFLDIGSEYQRERILKRNSPALAERFFNEWIPLENRYFSGMKVREHSDIIINIQKSTDF